MVSGQQSARNNVRNDCFACLQTLYFGEREIKYKKRINILHNFKYDLWNIYEIRNIVWIYQQKRLI